MRLDGPAKQVTMTLRFQPIQSLNQDKTMHFRLTQQFLINHCKLRSITSLALTMTVALQACLTHAGTVGQTVFILLPADQKAIYAMPRPQLAQVDLSGECRNTTLAFENAQAKAFWPAPGFITPLKHWGMYYAGSRVGNSQPTCFDQELDVKLWQSAIGTPITGRMSEKDVQECVRIIETVDQRYAYTHQTNRMSQDERAVDMFLANAQQGDVKAQFRVAGVYEKQNPEPMAVL